MAKLVRYFTIVAQKINVCIHDVNTQFWRITFPLEEAEKKASEEETQKETVEGKKVEN